MISQCSHFLTLAAFISLGIQSGEGQWWMEQPHGDTSFNTVVKYTDNATLECRNDSFVPEPFEVLYWILPNTTVMQRNDERSFFTLDGYAGWKVEDTLEANMVISVVQEQHFGFYYCVVMGNASGANYIIKKAINFYGPYFGDLWEIYWLNVTIGLSAAGGFLLIASIILIVYFCWYVPREEAQAQEEAMNNDVVELNNVYESTATGSGVNAAYSELGPTAVLVEGGTGADASSAPPKVGATAPAQETITSEKL